MDEEEYFKSYIKKVIDRKSKRHTCPFNNFSRLLNYIGNNPDVEVRVNSWQANTKMWTHSFVYEGIRFASSTAEKVYDLELAIEEFYETDLLTEADKKD